MERYTRSKLYAGKAKIKITPQEKDYREDRNFISGGFQGVSQNIYARALVLKAGERKVLLLSAEIIKMPDYDLLRKKIAERYGLIETDILMGGTQNHQCVVPDPVEVSSEDRLPYQKRVIEHLHASILEGLQGAFEDLQPARLGFASGASYINTCHDLTSEERRQAGDEGFCNRELFLLRVDSEDGAPIACLVNYCLMGIMMAANQDNWICGDIHGAVSAGLEAKIGGGVVALYLIGGSANAKPLIECSFEGYRPVLGQMEKQRMDLPRQAREMLRDLLATRQIEDAMALYNSIHCEKGDMFFRSGEIFATADARRIPFFNKRDDPYRRSAEGRLTHRLHLLSLGDELVFACGNSITSMWLDRKVRDLLPVKTVYVSVEGGSIGYVMHKGADPRSDGSLHSNLYSDAENEVVYLGGFGELFRTAQ